MLVAGVKDNSHSDKYRGAIECGDNYILTLLILAYNKSPNQMFIGGSSGHNT